MAKKYHLNERDHGLLGRTVRKVFGTGRGELPLPRRRRMVEGGGGGGSVNVLFCISNGIEAATLDWDAENGGAGSATPVNEDGTRGDTISFVNRSFDSIGANTPVLLISTSNAGYIAIPFCNEGPAIPEEE